MKYCYKKIIVLMVIVLILPVKNLQNVSAQDRVLNLPELDQVTASNSGASVDKLIEDLPKDASLADPYLFLINRLNPVSGEPWMDYAYTNEGYPFNATIYDAYITFVSEAANAGYPVGAISGFRSMAEQASNREARINSYLSEGLTYDEALYWTDAYYAPVDASEHLTGLALDFLGYDWTSIGGGLHGDYGYQGSAIWMAEHAYLYGFVLRYPEGKNDITGYNYEPWHFRYVGIDNAGYMHKHGLVLEEFLRLIYERDLRG